MRITVIGSAGRLGGHVVKAATAHGHHVTGLARRPERVPDQSPLVVTVRGDARDLTAMSTAVANADAVIMVLAGGDRADPTAVRDSARTLVRAMTTTGTRRLIMTSAYPIVARHPALVMALLRRVFATAYADTAHAGGVVTNSNLDWTIVRLNRLANAPSVGMPHVSTGELDRPTGLTRADAAELLVNLAESGDYSRVAVSVRGRDARG
ncbi:NAD(P)-dependent oxidoreductase [Microbacterium sp. A82]|uniref:NAD(P)-dependent oxidoreductase n=1 Tax=Microbacterium sp. A82 TaxID=3450452 RepID=UPI003F3231EA